MSRAGSHDKVAVGLVLAAALAAAVGGLRLARGAPAMHNASTDVLIARFETIREAAPRTGVVGYTNGLEPTDPAFLMRQMLARYALAPARLDTVDTHPMVLADFESDSTLLAYVARVGGTIHAHPRAGLAIVERGPSTP